MITDPNQTERGNGRIIRGASFGNLTWVYSCCRLTENSKNSGNSGGKETTRIIMNVTDMKKLMEQNHANLSSSGTEGNQENAACLETNQG